MFIASLKVRVTTVSAVATREKIRGGMSSSGSGVTGSSGSTGVSGLSEGEPVSVTKISSKTNDLLLLGVNIQLTPMNEVVEYRVSFASPSFMYSLSLFSSLVHKHQLPSRSHVTLIFSLEELIFFITSRPSINVSSTP